MEVEIPITELEEFDPERVDGVGKGANGFPILMMKGLPRVPAELGGDAAKAEAPSCATCKGSGKIRDGHVTCPDCKGSGKQPANDDNDDNGEQSAEKAELDAKARHALDDSDFAYIDSKGERHLPIHDEAHVRAALGRFNQTQFDNAADKKAAAKKILAAAKKFGINVSDDTAVTAAAKAVSGANPLFGTPVTPGDAQVPGSPSWEAKDADTASQAAQALMQAADCIREFAGREAAEYAAGEGNDLFDTLDAEQALDLVSAALGIMARLAFIEANGATKGDGEAAKAGKTLSTKSVDAIRAAIKALEDLLASAAGGSKKSGEDAANKSQEDILAMTKDELATFLDERDVAKAEARKAARQAKKQARAEKAEARKAARDAKKAAKAEKRAELSPEEIEARKAAKAEKRAAKRAEKQTAVTDAVVEVKEAVKSVASTLSGLQDRLSTVEKMAAPGGPAKTRTPSTLAKSEQRDALELAAAELERRAERELDAEVRKGLLDRAKQARDKLASLAA